VVSRASLEGFGEKKTSLLLPGFEPWITQPVPSCYIDYVTPVNSWR
jgi:hypothetical protein